MSGLSEVIVLAATLFFTLSWFVVVLISPWRRPSSKLSAPQRILSARTWLYAPLWAPIVLVSSALLPDLVRHLFQRENHCLPSLSEHLHHFCVLHPPHASGHSIPQLAVTSLLVLAAVCIVGWLPRIYQQYQIGRSLLSVSQASQIADEVRLLELSEPMALCLGLLRPRILLSKTLAQNLSKETLEVIIHHERAHIERKDLWWRLSDLLMTQMFPKVVSRPLLEQISLGQEQACDQVAAERCQQPAVVAQALVEVARLKLVPAPVGLSAAAGSLEARINYLLEERKPYRAIYLRALALALLCLTVSAETIHTAIEHGLTYLIH